MENQAAIYAGAAAGLAWIVYTAVIAIVRIRRGTTSPLFVQAGALVVGLAGCFIWFGLTALTWPVPGVPLSEGILMLVAWAVVFSDEENKR